MSLRIIEGSSRRIDFVGAGMFGLSLARCSSRARESLFEKVTEPRVDGCGILLVSSGVAALAGAEIRGSRSESWPVDCRRR